MSYTKSLTIGILAHVDAGKTSLTECLLYAAGVTTDIGSVDQGSAITDGLAMEKNRGISIKTATVDFVWQDTQVNIVDTPGHVDFAAEVDRALSVIDVVVLVISAVEGIQAHTLSLWESLQERELPVIVFVNKVDRDGADPEQVFLDIEKDLEAKLFTLNYTDISDPNDPKLIELSKAQSYLLEPIIENSLENLAELDEAFMESYLEGNLGEMSLISSLGYDKIKSNQLTALIYGSAKLGLGIELLLSTLTTIHITSDVYSKEVSAKVFKVEYDPKVGRLAHIRLYGGDISNKDSVWSQHLQKDIKINQILQRKLGKLQQVAELTVGEIGVVVTSELILAGDVLGVIEYDKDFSPLGESVLSVQAIADDEKNYQSLGEALEILNNEDPQLDFRWYKDDREFHMRILGPIQTEVLKDSLLNRFGIEATFHKPKVIYKETPKSKAEGYVRYWMPKPCWAIMTFVIEPGELGSGVVFDSKVRTSDISVKYQNEVKRAIPWSLNQGIKGWEVTDIKITLMEGSEHNVHSNPGDFLLATPMGIMRGLENADTDLLEPMYAFQVKAQQSLLGAIVSDMNQMGAHIDSPSFDGDFFILSGRVAVSQAMDYSIKFNATTSGKGRLKLNLDGYQKTETTEDKIRDYKGVSPLDESQWILHNRGAFKAEDRRR